MVREIVDIIKGMAVNALVEEKDYKHALEAIVEYINIKEEEGGMLTEASPKAKEDRIRAHRETTMRTRPGRLDFEPRLPLPADSSIDENGNVTLRVHESHQAREHAIYCAYIKADKQRQSLIKVMEKVLPFLNEKLIAFTSRNSARETREISEIIVEARRALKSAKSSVVEW